MVLPATSRMVKKTAVRMAVMILAMFADLTGEALEEGAFWFGLGLGGGVGELAVDGRGHLRRALGIADAHGVPPHLTLGEAPGLVEVVVVEEELTGVGALLGPLVDADEVELQVELPSCLVQMVAWMGIRSPTSQPKRSAVTRPDDGAGSGVQKRLALVVVEDVLRKHVQEQFGFHGHLGEEVRGLLVDAAEPGLVHDLIHALDAAHAIPVGLGQELDDGHLVADHQPVLPGDVHALVEGHADRGEEAEKDERHGDAKPGEQGAELLPLEVRDDEPQVLHAAGSSASRPLSM
jgi:hypothetical protein